MVHMMITLRMMMSIMMMVDDDDNKDGDEMMMMTMISYDNLVSPKYCTLVVAVNPY
jgi:hypothetical protein